MRYSVELELPHQGALTGVWNMTPMSPGTLRSPFPKGVSDEALFVAHRDRVWSAPELEAVQAHSYGRVAGKVIVPQVVVVAEGARTTLAYPKQESPDDPEALEAIESLARGRSDVIRHAAGSVLLRAQAGTFVSELGRVNSFTMWADSCRGGDPQSDVYAKLCNGALPQYQRYAEFLMGVEGLPDRTQQGLESVMALQPL
jgi:hypothetical protein